MKDLSILIPTYNEVCVELVSTLQQQAETLGIHYEIIVADDGSTNQLSIDANRRINQLPHCRLVEQEKNSGRAVIRNFLAQQACMPWLLFLDSDMKIGRSDFLLKYVTATDADIIVGGISIVGDKEKLRNNIRYLYEQDAAPKHTLQARQTCPYHSFSTANFMASRKLMNKIHFDERFRYYGYEDVLFGKLLEEHHIDILHIDNPVNFTDFESNDHYIRKTEEGMRTLHRFRQELRGHSTLISLEEKHPFTATCIRLWHGISSRWERRVLTGAHPRLTLFKIYRIGYFLTLQ